MVNRSGCASCVCFQCGFAAAVSEWACSTCSCLS
jgi:hypothetical protein